MAPWVKIFVKVLKKIKKAAPKIAKAAGKYGPILWEAIKQLAPKVLDWWNGKKIAVIGPTAVGKNCLYCRLKDEPIPDQHHKTKSPEHISTFKFQRTLPNRKTFQVTFKRCINVGGEAEQRRRFWLDACKDADIIFYMLTLDVLEKGRFGKGTRLRGDLRWLAAQLPKMKSNVAVHLLVNKIDTALADGDGFEDLIAKLEPCLKELEGTVNGILGDYGERLTGISPTSMKDDHLFAISFPAALEEVYEAVHTR